MTQPAYVHYCEDLETIEPVEPETFRAIAEMMLDVQGTEAARP